MKPAPEDPEHRRPVWQALSDLFLDTDTSISRSWRVGILSASPYSIDELQEILLDEVYPVCRSNFYWIAGEWASFDPEWLESRILRRLHSPFHRLEWRRTKEGIVRQSAEKDEIRDHR